MMYQKHTFVERKKKELLVLISTLHKKKDRAQLLNLDDLFEPYKGT